MQRLEVSGAVRLIYRSLGVKGLRTVNEAVASKYVNQLSFFKCLFSLNSILDAE